MMVSSPAKLALEIHRVFEAEISVVFRAFSDPGELARWWGPKGFAIPNPEFEPRIGERYRIEMHPPEGDPFYLTGEFREVDPPTRMSYTFEWEEPDPDDMETLVELLFRDLGGATQVSMTQQPFKTEDRLALHRAGWADSLDKLEQVLATQK